MILIHLVFHLNFRTERRAARWRASAFASVTIVKSNGGQIKATHEIECVRDYNERICPSFFKREFFHNMFNKPKQSA